MKKFIIIFLIIPVYSIFSQDWQLFNTEYISYYRNTEYELFSPLTLFKTVDHILEFQFEKEMVSENDYIYTSTRINPKNSNDSCLFTIRQQDNLKSFGEDEMLIDMYNITNDTLYCYDEIFGNIRSKNYKFILPLNMNKNDSLVKNKRKIKFVESKQVEVLAGLYDSAKVFSIENFEYIPPTTTYLTLTQHYGIIDYLLRQKYKLCGLKKIIGNESYGYIPQKSNIDNILNMKVGDFKIWEIEEFYLDRNSEFYFLKDVVKSISFKNDSIKIEFVRTKYIYPDPVDTKLYEEIYCKQYCDEMTSNRQSTIHLINIKPKYNFNNKTGISVVEGAGYIEYQDTKQKTAKRMIEYTDKGEYLIGECESAYITDHSLVKIIHPDIGEYFIRAGADALAGITTMFVRGYSLNGEIYGNIPDFLSVKDPNTNSVSIFPNPATDIINIDLGNYTLQGVGEGQTIRIFDVLGEKVMTIETRSNVSLQQIDVSALLPGVYFLRIGDVVQKFVKM